MSMEPEADNRDRSAIMQATALAESARQIHQLHIEAQEAKDAAVKAIDETFDKMGKVAVVTEQAQSTLGQARFSRWWSDQCLPSGWDKRYMKIAGLRSKEREPRADKGQLQLVGIMLEPEGMNEGYAKEDVDYFGWIKWSGKITKTFKDFNLDEWGETEVEASLKQLEPIKEIIQSLEERMKGY